MQSLQFKEPSLPPLPSKEEEAAVAELVEEEEELQEEEFVSSQVAQNLSCVVTTCTVGPMADALIVELHVAESLKAIRTMRPLRTRWEAALQIAHLAMLLLLLDGNPLAHDGVERKIQI